MRIRLSDKETELKELIDCLKGKADEIFAVANLRPYRSVNSEWLRENMPDTFNALVKVSDTNAGKIIHASHTREEANKLLAELNPKLFDQVASVSITDLERELGKAKTKELDGTAVTTEMRVVSGTSIVIKHPEKYDQLPAGESEDGEEL